MPVLVATWYVCVCAFDGLRRERKSKEGWMEGKRRKKGQEGKVGRGRESRKGRKG